MKQLRKVLFCVHCSELHRRCRRKGCGGGADRQQYPPKSQSFQYGSPIFSQTYGVFSVAKRILEADFFTATFSVTTYLHLNYMYIYIYI